MNEWFANLSQSEKRTLTVAGIVLSLILLYVLVWDPLHKGVYSLREQAKQEKELLVYMTAAASEAKELQSSQRSGSVSLRGGQSLLSVVDQTAKLGKLGTALKRVEPKGRDEVRVRLENAPFDDMVRWLEKLQRNYKVDVDTISIDRQPDAGRVNANLALKEAA